MYQVDNLNGGHKRVDYNTMQFWNAIEHRDIKDNSNNIETNINAKIRRQQL